MLKGSTTQAPQWQSVETSVSSQHDQQLSAPRITPEIDRVLSQLRIPSESILIADKIGRAVNPLSDQEKALYQLQRENTLAALRAAAQLTGEIADYKRAIPKILSAAKNASNGNEELGCQLALDVVRDKVKELRAKFAAIAHENPESFFVVHSRTFRRYSRQLNSGRIAITPFVAEKIDEVMGILRTTGMVILHGPTGSGKSEVAEIVARKISGKKPLVISGHRDVSAREFKGHDALQRSGGCPPHEIPDHIETAKEEYRKSHPLADEETTRSALRHIEERLIHENSVTVSEFVLGYAYKAAKEGVPLIIDEFNLIDPTVIMGLNSLMTKQHGEMVHIPENSHPPFPVAEGFFVIMTGNINTGSGVEYYRPHKTDASTTGRFSPVEYGFPPQTTEGTAAQAHPDEKQLYQIILSTLRSRRPSSDGSDLGTRLEDRAMVTHLPGGAQCLDKLWRLAKLATITQLALEGKVSQDSPHAHLINGTKQAAHVEHALTPRVVVNLLQQWKGSGFEYELDHYVFKALVESALTAGEKDYFYRQCRLQGFCVSPGWTEIIDDGSERLYSDVHSPMNPREASPETVPGRILIREIHGDPPERVMWPGQAPMASKVDKQRLDTAERLRCLTEIERELHEVQSLLEGTRWLDDHSLWP